MCRARRDHDAVVLVLRKGSATATATCSMPWASAAKLCSRRDMDGVCDDEILGCDDADACNYDETATDNDGSCVYAEYYDCTGTCLSDTDGDGVCDEFEIAGCLDEMAATTTPRPLTTAACARTQRNSSIATAIA